MEITKTIKVSFKQENHMDDHIVIFVCYELEYDCAQ